MLFLEDVDCLLKFDAIFVHVVIFFADDYQSVMGRNLLDVVRLFWFFPEFAEIARSSKREVVVSK
jgi:hypothetical protein